MSSLVHFANYDISWPILSAIHQHISSFVCRLKVVNSWPTCYLTKFRFVEKLRYAVASHYNNWIPYSMHFLRDICTIATYRTLSSSVCSLPGLGKREHVILEYGMSFIHSGPTNDKHCILQSVVYCSHPYI